MNSFTNNVVLDAYAIATKALTACSVEQGIVAGGHHFVDLWARDSLFACLGALSAGNTDIARRTITSFLDGQQRDGLLPYRLLRAPSSVGKYRGHPRYFAEPKANYRSHQSGGIVPDGGLMTVQAAQAYLSVSEDLDTVTTWYPHLSAGMAWYEERFGEGLVREWFLCEWADAVLKRGKVLYTNVLYFKSLGDMSGVAERLGRLQNARRYTEAQARVKELLNREFWTGTHYADWIDHRRQDYFSSHVNMLSIIYGLAGEDKAKSILAMARNHCLLGWTLETNWPKYPWWRIPLQNYVVGMADYHNRGCLWLQPGLMYILALQRLGKKQEARTRLEAAAAQIVKYGDVFEVYEKDGTPVNRRWYTSEHPFAWSAGLFIHTCHELGLGQGH